MITGYFNDSHFQDANHQNLNVGAMSIDDAKKLLDPGNVLTECKLEVTPQFCTKYEWQIEDSVDQKKHDQRPKILQCFERLL